MKTFIVYVREAKEEDKIGPQVKACMAAVARACGKVGGKAERQAVIKELTDGSELQTRQDPARILSFYQPQLKEKGLIDIVKEADPKPAAKAEGDKKTAPGPAAASPAKGKAPAPASGASA